MTLPSSCSDDCATLFFPAGFVAILYGRSALAAALVTAR